MHTRLLIILIVANIPIYLLISYALFNSWLGFINALIYFFTPNIVSAARGEYWDDRWASLKFFVFLLCCAVVVHGEYTYIVKHFL